jgi:hypothetical protein
VPDAHGVRDCEPVALGVRVGDAPNDRLAVALAVTLPVRVTDRVPDSVPLAERDGDGVGVTDAEPVRLGVSVGVSEVLRDAVPLRVGDAPCDSDDVGEPEGESVRDGLSVREGVIEGLSVHEGVFEGLGENEPDFDRVTVRVGVYVGVGVRLCGATGGIAAASRKSKSRRRISDAAIND